MPQASDSIFIAAPAETIFKIVWDFAKYPTFLPDVKKVKKSGSAKNPIVEFEIDVIKKIHYSLKFSSVPFSEITWEFIKGDFFKENRGSWSFEEKKGKTKVTYSVEVEFGLFVPSFMMSKLVGARLPAMLEKFQERAERASTGK